MCKKIRSNTFLCHFVSVLPNFSILQYVITYNDLMSTADCMKQIILQIYILFWFSTHGAINAILCKKILKLHNVQYIFCVVSKQKKYSSSEKCGFCF